MRRISIVPRRCPTAYLRAGLKRKDRNRRWKGMAWATLLARRRRPGGGQ